MNYYRMSKEYIAIGITNRWSIKEWNNFIGFIREEYSSFSLRNVEKYINKIDYIRGKL